MLLIDASYIFKAHIQSAVGKAAMVVLRRCNIGDKQQFSIGEMKIAICNDIAQLDLSVTNNDIRECLQSLFRTAEYSSYEFMDNFVYQLAHSLRSTER